MPTRSWTTRSLLRPCTRHCASDTRRAAAAGGMVRRPRWCCGCSFSSMPATGASRFSSAKCAATLSIATLPASAAAKCRMPRPWAAGAWRWGQRSSGRFTSGLSKLLSVRGLWKVGGCALVKLQEAENQIVIDFEVYDQRPNDSDLLVPAIDIHQATLGRAPYLVAADAAFYSSKNEAAAKAKGVKRVCVPNRSTKSVERRREQKKRWFRNGQKWRTGCEGRISVTKRRHGLNRCRYKGQDGMRRWVGLGVISDNLINIAAPSTRNRQASNAEDHE